MTLKDQFILHFKNHEQITTKEILEWYKQVKRGTSGHTYHSTIYSIIINPLIDEGRLRQTNRGVYIIVTNMRKAVEPTKETISIQGGDDYYKMNNEELDDLDAYLEDKIKGG